MSIDEPQLRRRAAASSSKPSTSSSGLEPPPPPYQRNDPTHSPNPTVNGSRVSSFVKNSSMYAFILVVAMSFLTRYWKIWDPAQVVFDEVHFGKFASYYLRKEYYFDVHPPLAKMLIALGGWLIDYDGYFLFEKIGMDYISNGVPYIMLRGWVALFGFALPPLVYMIMAESGYSVVISLFSALLATFDNALVTQGRLILLDNIMLFFMLAGVFCYIRFFKQRYSEFGFKWWIWLLNTGVMLGCVVSCKLVGLFTIMLIGAAVLADLWRILDFRRGTTMSQFVNHFVARAFALIVVPFAIYLSFFYVHFAVLTHTGPGDAYHSSKFQMQLIDNPMTVSSFSVYYGDQITFRHRDTGVYLDSNTGRYPLRYEDQRVSSQGQQVTGNRNMTDNSYWILKPATEDAAQQEEFAKLLARRQKGEEVPQEELNKWAVRHTDLVQILHVATNTHLRTHDVASPMTATNMEITTLPLNDTASYVDTLWQIQIDRARTNATVLKTTSSFIRIASNKHKVAMWTHSKRLPKWGQSSQEINGNKKSADKGTLWTVSEIRGREASDEELEDMKKKVQPMGFLEKFSELQGLMIKHNNALTKVHPFQSTPLSWPLLTRGISFWTNAKERKQIYLLGNFFGWYLSNYGVLAYGMIVLTTRLLAHRNCDTTDPITVRHLERSGGFFVFAWFIHYFPFFLMGRSLFLHHYLPASIFAYMIVGVSFQFLLVRDYRRFALRSWSSRARNLVPSVKVALLLTTIMAIQVAAFVFMSPLTYGTTSLTPQQVLQRKIWSSYDLHYQK